MPHFGLTFPTRHYGGYIFDCDGTLADSMPLHHKAWNYALQKHGASFEYTAELFKSLAGVGHADTVRKLNKKFGDDLDPDAVTHDKEAWYEQRIGELQPLEEVCAFARQMHAAGARISVASGGPRKGVLRTLDIIGCADLFEPECIVTQDDVSRSKPDPEIFLLAAKRMGVDPLECIVFEDSPLGIQGAEACGMAWMRIPSTI